MSQHAAFQCLGGIDPQPRHTGRCASNTTITNSSAPPCLRGQIPAFQTGRRSRPRSRVSAAASLASFNRGERSSEYHDPSTAVLLLCDAGTASTVDDTAFTLNVAARGASRAAEAWDGRAQLAPDRQFSYTFPRPEVPAHRM